MDFHNYHVKYFTKTQKSCILYSKSIYEQAASETNRVAPSNDEQTNTVSTTEISNEQPSTIELPVIKSNQEEECVVPDPDSENSDELTDIIDTTTILEELAKELEKERSEKEKEKSLNQSDDSSTEDAELEDIKFIIKTIGQAVRFANGEEIPDPEADKVMEDLDKGFKAGYDASKQYEEMLEAASSVEKTVDFFTSFFFGGNTSLAFFLSCIHFMIISDVQYILSLWDINHFHMLSIVFYY